jgi:TatA/E family protein of Tat protein translocase
MSSLGGTTMLPDVGWPELIVILIVALLVFGPERLAGVGAAVGKAIREFRMAVREGDDNAPPPSHHAGDDAAARSRDRGAPPR